ncbi:MULTISPECIES: hypothetical protein [Paenibacillus]|nr:MULTISPECIES: hypothetical protein [Paenibacillus]
MPPKVEYSITEYGQRMTLHYRP